MGKGVLNTRSARDIGKDCDLSAVRTLSILDVGIESLLSENWLELFAVSARCSVVILVSEELGKAD